MCALLLTRRPDSRTGAVGDVADSRRPLAMDRDGGGTRIALMRTAVLTIGLTACGGSGQSHGAPAGGRTAYRLAKGEKAVLYPEELAAPSRLRFAP